MIDIRTIPQQEHRDISLESMPSVLSPRKGRFDLIDYEKNFCVDPRAGDIADVGGVDRETGCMVLVRPDQYVSTVLPLDAAQALADLLSRVLIDMTAASAVAGAAGAVS